jgi:hypothetical protein
MPVSDELLFQNLSTVQGRLQPKPATIASAATIAPVGFLTFISGTTAVATITPPISGAHLLALVFTNANPSAFTGAGNVQSTKDPAQNELVLLAYDPITAKYYVCNP